MPTDEKPAEKASTPAPAEEEVVDAPAPVEEKSVEGSSVEQPTDIHEALKTAKEVEKSQTDEDNPMNDETDPVGDPIVGVTGDMYRPPYVPKAD